MGADTNKEPRTQRRWPTPKAKRRMPTSKFIPITPRNSSSSSSRGRRATGSRPPHSFNLRFRRRRYRYQLLPGQRRDRSPHRRSREQTGQHRRPPPPPHAEEGATRHDGRERRTTPPADEDEAGKYIGRGTGVRVTKVVLARISRAPTAAYCIRAKIATNNSSATPASAMTIAVVGRTTPAATSSGIPECASVTTTPAAISSGINEGGGRHLESISPNPAAFPATGAVSSAGTARSQRQLRPPRGSFPNYPHRHRHLPRSPLVAHVVARLPPIPPPRGPAPCSFSRPKQGLPRNFSSPGQRATTPPCANLWRAPLAQYPLSVARSRRGAVDARRGGGGYALAAACLHPAPPRKVELDLIFRRLRISWGMSCHEEEVWGGGG